MNKLPQIISLPEENIAKEGYEVYYFNADGDICVGKDLGEVPQPSRYIWPEPPVDLRLVLPKGNLNLDGLPSNSKIIALPRVLATDLKQ